MNASYRALAVAAVIFGLGVTSVIAQDASKTAAPDNTKVNKRDRKKAEPTADQQKNGNSDIHITADIRKAIIADKSLSTYAHNVKIITKGGAVTLKGPVRSDEEKKSVEDKAGQVAGADKVTSQITVRAKAPKS